MNNAIDVPLYWWELAEKIYHDKGVVMALGSPDTGKTTLINYLFIELNNKGRLTSIIDADIGQSFYGVPATMSLVRHSSKSEGLTIDKSYFVGSTSPTGHLLQMVVGLRKLLDNSDSDITLIDTTGFVMGGAAWELKYQKIETASPRHIVAIQRTNEIENILHPQELRGLAKIHRLPVHEKVKPKSPDQRKASRQAKYKAYFQNVRRSVFSLKNISIINPYKVPIEDQSPSPPLTKGEQPPQSPFLKGEKGDFKGTLIGLNNSENLLVCLGILEGIDTERKEISCFIPSHPSLSPKGRGKGEGVEDVKTIRLGSVCLDATYADHKI